MDIIIKTILILGAGFIVKPMVIYLLEHNFRVNIASLNVNKAKSLFKNYENAKAMAFNIVKDAELLDYLIAEADLVVSLLPYVHHVTVANTCLKYSKHLVTTSYVSNAMQSLDKLAIEKRVILLNECGVDPGFDHMTAMRIIDKIKYKKGKIISFTSNTGGLPAPEANNNPFGYKFSWSPRGVVLAAKNPAKYKKNGKIIIIKEGTLFKPNNIGIISLKYDNLGDFQYYANRDSLKYIDLYQIPEVQTMFRGTLRNLGWCETWDKMFDLGYLNLEELSDVKGLTFSQFMARLCKISEEHVKAQTAEILGLPEDHDIIQRIEWLGLFSTKKIQLNQPNISPFDVLVQVLFEKLGYKSGERDMVVMVHEIIVEYPDGTNERISSVLVNYGIPNGDSSMARTVSLPAAIACRLILDGTISQRGVIIPTSSNIYNPILDELKQLNIEMIEKITIL